MPAFALSSILAIVQYILGSHYLLFLLYLGANVVDFLSVLVRLYSQQTKFDGKKLVRGLVKKVGYWLVIAVAFGASAMCMTVGESLGIDLGVTQLLGWFVLASLLFQELRSILQNLSLSGIAIPKILTDILVIAEKNLDAVEETAKDGALILNTTDPSVDTCRLSMDCSFEELKKKRQITLAVLDEDKSGK